MGKYPEWVLVKRELVPNTDFCALGDEKGNILRKIRNTYACPHCLKTFATLTNEVSARKCRWCGQKVSPYTGDTAREIWLPKGVETLD